MRGSVFLLGFALAACSPLPSGPGDASTAPADASDVSAPDAASPEGAPDASDESPTYPAGSAEALRFVEASSSRWYEALCGPAPRCDALRAEVGVCAALMRGKLQSFRPEPLFTAVAHGQVRMHSLRLEQCLQEIAARPCEQFDVTNPYAYGTCSDVFEPLVGPGGACDDDAACGRGMRCGKSSCSGTCQAVPPNGCGTVLHCPAPLRCEKFQCVTARPPGGAGQPCSTEGLCQPGLRCLQRATATQPAATCAPLARAGEPCVAIGDCEAGAFCGAGICKLLKAPGDACTSRGECAPGLSYVECDTALGRCVQAPKQGPCVLETQSLCQQFYAWCDKSSAPPECRPFRALGDVCASPSECAPPGAADGDVSCKADAMGTMRCTKAPPACVP